LRDALICWYCENRADLLVGASFAVDITTDTDRRTTEISAVTMPDPVRDWETAFDFMLDDSYDFA
jgi:hypothetical protein